MCYQTKWPEKPNFGIANPKYAVELNPFRMIS